MEYGDLVEVWKDKFIVRDVIRLDHPRWDDIEETYYERWNDEIQDLGWDDNVFSFGYEVFIEVVNVETMESEIIIGGTKDLGDSWTTDYDSKEELGEVVDLSTEGEQLWFRVGIDRNGGEFVTYFDTPQLVV